MPRKRQNFREIKLYGVAVMDWGLGIIYKYYAHGPREGSVANSFAVCTKNCELAVCTKNFNYIVFTKCLSKSFKVRGKLKEREHGPVSPFWAVNFSTNLLQLNLFSPFLFMIILPLIT